MKQNTKIIIAVIAVVIIGGGAWWSAQNSEPGKYDIFAQCLKDKGAIFYGAFWCPHCQSQKSVFGKSAKYLPYIECSTADGKGQLKVCTEKGIEGYPTWKFRDGAEEQGEVSPKILSEKTGCALPQ